MITRSRPERGTRRLDMSGMRQAMRDRRYWIGVGLVYRPNGEEHWELDADIGVLVNVELMPDREPLLCRLSGLGEGGTHGVWRIPPVGSEVVIGIPGGDLENDPILLGVLASGGVPSELDADTLVVRAPKVVVIATDDRAEIGQKGLGSSEDIVVQAALDDALAALAAAISALSGASDPSVTALTALRSALNALNAGAGWKARTSKSRAK